MEEFLCGFPWTASCLDVSHLLSASVSWLPPIKVIFLLGYLDPNFSPVNTPILLLASLGCILRWKSLVRLLMSNLLSSHLWAFWCMNKNSNIIKFKSKSKAYFKYPFAKCGGFYTLILFYFVCFSIYFIWCFHPELCCLPLQLLVTCGYSYLTLIIIQYNIQFLWMEFLVHNSHLWRMATLLDRVNCRTFPLEQFGLLTSEVMLEHRDLKSEAESYTSVKRTSVLPQQCWDICWFSDVM